MADTKVYLPKQHVRRGVAGYKPGPDIVVVDDKGKESKTGGKDLSRSRKVITSGH